jgi:hypothetical protein
MGEEVVMTIKAVVTKKIIWDNGNVTVSDIDDWGCYVVSINAFPAVWDEEGAYTRVYKSGSLVIMEWHREGKLPVYSVWDPKYQNWAYMA